MKILQITIFILITNFCFSQTKEQLIDSIIKVNSVHSDCVGMACSESEQYRNFQKLKKKLSDKELIELTKNKNPVIRTYASIEVIDTNKGNPLDLLSYELNRNESVETYEGCIIDYEKTSSIIYHRYWNKIRMKASEETMSENESEIAMKKALEADIIMEKLDSLIINSDKEIYWLLYSRSFENRKFKESNLPKIEELAFNKNNSYAFEYLKENYPTKYKERIEKYLTVDFAKAKFITENDVFYLHYFLQILLESKNENYKKIAIKKLKTNKIWRNHSDWFKTTFEKNGIKL